MKEDGATEAANFKQNKTNTDTCTKHVKKAYHTVNFLELDVITQTMNKFERKQANSPNILKIVGTFTNHLIR